ncbi:hypothetical protein D3C80_1569000 [compost metagenome]
MPKVVSVPLRCPRLMYSENTLEKSRLVSPVRMFFPSSSTSTARPAVPGVAITNRPRPSSVLNSRDRVNSRSMLSKAVSPGSMV